MGNNSIEANSKNNTIQLTQLPDSYWTEILSPKVSLFDLKLVEVWRYRDLLWLFVKRDFVSTYKQTVLGPLWHLLQPVLTTIMFMVVFRGIANIPMDNGISAVPFFMAGLTIWNYFSACLTGTSNTFVGNAAIFGKVYFPRLVLPLSIILSNIIKFFIQFVLLFAILVFYSFKEGHFYFGATWLLIPFLLVIMAGLGLGLGILISSLTTKYKDFTVLISFGVQLLMYATPVAYPLSYLKDKSKFAYIIELNPLTSIVEAFKYAIFGTPTFNYSTLLYSFIFMVASLISGILIFNKTEKSFMDTV